MTLRKFAWAVGAVALSISGATANSQAEERQITTYVTLGATSDYMFRGISYTDQKPAANAYIEFDYGIAYFGSYTSSVDYGIYGPLEQDFVLGFRPVTGAINWDFNANWYTYGNRDKGKYGSTFDIDYFEFKIGATTSVTKELTVGASVWLTPDQGYAATDNISVEGTASYVLPKVGIFTPTVSGLLGYSESGTSSYYPTGYWEGTDSYTYWNAGLKLDVDKYFVDFRYWDTTIDSDLADSRFVLSAGWNLLP